MKTKIQYIGRRLLDDKIFHVFLYKNKEIYYAKAKWVLIGKWYEMEIENKKRLLKTIPIEVDGPEASELTLEKWIIEDRVAQQFINRRKTANKFIKKPEMFKNFYELKKAYKIASFSQKKLLLEAFWDFLDSEE